MKLTKFVELRFKEHFAKWAKIQIADAIEEYSRSYSIEFAKWLIENGHCENVSKVSVKYLAEKFYKIKTDDLS